MEKEKLNKREKLYLYILIMILVAVIVLSAFNVVRISLGWVHYTESQIKANYVFMLCLFFVWIFYFVMFIIRIQVNRREKMNSVRDNIIIREVIETFTGIVDAKDTYTAGHSSRVGDYTRIIAEEMGYSDEQCQELFFAAILHDSGKIVVDDDILTKPDTLTREEFSDIKMHTIKGYNILKNLKHIPYAANVARYHHERYDGKGYPDGIRGDDIPFAARIVAVADAFDAMNTSRCYRAERTEEYIMEELRKNAGKQFDPDVVEALFRAINAGKIRFSEVKSMPIEEI